MRNLEPSPTMHWSGPAYSEWELRLEASGVTWCVALEFVSHSMCVSAVRCIGCKLARRIPSLIWHIETMVAINGYMARFIADLTGGRPWEGVDDCPNKEVYQRRNLGLAPPTAMTMMLGWVVVAVEDGGQELQQMRHQYEERRLLRRLDNSSKGRSLAWRETLVIKDS